MKLFSWIKQLTIIFVQLNLFIYFFDTFNSVYWTNIFFKKSMQYMFKRIKKKTCDNHNVFFLLLFFIFYSNHNVLMTLSIWRKILLIQPIIKLSWWKTFLFGPQRTIIKMFFRPNITERLQSSKYKVQALTADLDLYIYISEQLDSLSVSPTAVSLDSLPLAVEIAASH